MEHPADEILKRFAEGKASREEGRAVVAHLLKGCRSCQEKIKAFLEPRPVARGAHEAVLKRFERRVAGRLMDLEETPPPSGPVVLPRLPSSLPGPKGKGREG